jgi:UDP-2,3-diacylglucosamine hydrolase
VLENDKIDYFVYGHRHLALEYNLEQGSHIIFLGDWIKEGSFAEWNNNGLILRIF